MPTLDRTQYETEIYETLVGAFEPLIQLDDEQRDLIAHLADRVNLRHANVFVDLIEDVRARAEERAVNAFIGEVEARLKADEDTD